MKYTSDDELPVVTDEMLDAARQTTKPFTIVILRAGPKFEMPGSDRTSGVTSIIWAHGKRNFALHRAGLMPIVCPIGDGSGVTGVCIFDASPEDVERIMSQDPGVKAGVFIYDIHPTRTFPGSALPGEQAGAPQDLQRPWWVVEIWQ